MFSYNKPFRIEMMSGVIDQKFYYGHGIVSQNCFAKEYSGPECIVKLLFTGTFVQVHAICDDEVLFCVVRDDMQVETNQMVCKKADIIIVPENLWEPLFTVKKEARLSLVKDSRVAESIGNISVGDTVQVLGPDNSVICIANVSFRNSVARLGVGIYFGLQVLSSKEIIQTIIEKVSLLEPGTKGFPRGCDIVLTIDKIRPHNCSFSKEYSARKFDKFDKECQKHIFKSISNGENISSGSFKSVISYNAKEKTSTCCIKDQGASSPDSECNSCLKKRINSDNPLNLGDEVIYLDEDTPEKGVVRWIGLIDNCLKIGVEFDNPIGGRSFVDGLGELFRAKHQHAMFLPPMALIKLSDYQINYSKDTVFLKKNNINIQNNNNNINNNNNHNNNINNNKSNSGNNNNNNNNYNYNHHHHHHHHHKNNKNNNNNNVNNNNFNHNNNNNNSVKIYSNESNNINNNEDHCKTNEFRCEVKQNAEEISRRMHHQCFGHSDKHFDFTDCFQGVNKDAVFDKKDSYLSEHKSGNAFEEGHNISKSFDFGRASEKKTVGHRRHSSSVDNSLVLQKDSDSYGSAQNGKNHLSWNLSSHELSDLAGVKPEKTRNNYYCADRNQQKCSDKEEEEDLAFNKSSSVHLKSVSGKDKWDSQYSGHSSSDENLGNFCESFNPSYPGSYIPEDLGKGSVVELTFKGESHYGVIRWIGTFPEEKDSPHRLIAGIEMEEECPGFTDGTFNNKRYFQCNSRKALFVPLSKCRKDSRFLEESQKQIIPSKVNYGQIDCPIVEGTIPPINRKGEIESICGKNRGIQGHHNSCYLDATLFSMFAFTSVFDSLLYRPPTKNDIPQYSEVQKVLRDEIVNPLRKNLYVRADRVMKLRTLLEELSSVSGLTSEEKDPEEFLNSLLAQILRAEPFLKLSSGQEAFHYQLFVEKDERLVFPSVQQLFEQSFVTSDIKLKQIPSCLIIQMPRFGKSFKMYSRILPPQLLDITDIIENSPRQCTVCGKLAEFECKDCFGQQGIGNVLESISFCKTCLDTAHNHHWRSSHHPRGLTVPFEFYELQEHCIIPRLYMELFAVVCIETSHYVAFVKCGSGSDAPWCFFDSMADRKGEQNGYNIPEMVPCPDLPYWLSEDGAKMLNEMRDERQLPEHAKRLFSDAYMCMYQSPDLMMYR